MSFPEAIGCQTKSPGPDVGYLPSPQVIDQKCPKDIAFDFPPEHDGKILFCKTPHTSQDMAKSSWS